MRRILKRQNVIIFGLYVILVFVSLFFLLRANFSPSKDKPLPRQEFVKAKIEESGKTITARILTGSQQGNKVTIQSVNQTFPVKLKTGDTVVLNKTQERGETTYYFNDQYRINRVLVVLALFLIVVFLVSGIKGIGSVIGLLVSLSVLFSYVIPSILSGKDPLMVSFVGAVIILLVSTYVAHGFSKQTTVALVSTFLSLVLTLLVAKFAVSYSLLSGFGTEDAYDLYFAGRFIINMQGLLLGGIMIATVGALNDVTTTQAATVAGLAKLNPTMRFKELLAQGFVIGKEHVISLINTLVLAYAGSSLAVFIVLFYNPQNQPYWTILNSEIINEEIIKTLAGTMGLLLSMPIVTFIAAILYDKRITTNSKIFIKSVLK